MKPIGVAKLKKILCKAAPIVKAFGNEKLTAERCAELFSNSLAVMLPKADASQRWAAWQCFQPLIGSYVSCMDIKAVLCRVAASLHLICEGIQPPLWDGSKTQAVMQCIGVNPDIKENTGKKVSRRLIVHMLCLLGEPAGLHFSISLSTNLLEYMIGKKLGLSYRKYNAPAEEITGCIFKCAVSEDIARAYVSDFETSAIMKDMNKQLAEARLSFTKCKTPAVPCSMCRKTLSDCGLAVWK